MTKLYGHLVHHIVNQVRVCGNGEAMAMIGLSGAANLETLKISIEAYVAAVLESKRLHLKNIDHNINFRDNEDVIGCAYLANMAFLARFVKKHHLGLNCLELTPAELIPENITEITLTEGNTKGTVASVINRFENLKHLKFPHGSAYWLMREVKKAGLKLDKLESLSLRLSPEELRSLVNLTPKIVFPEIVNLFIFESAPVDISVVLAFPEVKKIYYHIGFSSRINLDLVKAVSKTVKGFPNAKFPTIALQSRHTVTDTDPAEISKLYDWLNAVQFHTMVNVSVQAVVNFDIFEDPQQARENLLTFGFTRKRLNDGYILVRDFTWVQLTHNIYHIEGPVEEEDTEAEDEDAVEDDLSETGSEDDDHEDEDDADSSE